ncbi:Copia protein [Anthophora plagiata]
MLPLKNHNKSYLASQESTNENEGTSGSLDTRNIGGTKVNVMLWHRRLGHICEEYLTKMRRKEMVRGLDYPVQSLGTCEVCKRNKTIEEDYTVIDNEDQEEEQINRNNQEEQVSDRIEDEEIEPEIQEIEEDRESRKRGRKLGRSNQDVREEHRKQLIERERRLREEGVKRSTRLQEKEEQTNFINIQDIELPNNLTEAIKSKDSENWEKAMAKEITTMNQLGVWKLVQRQEGIKMIKSRWVYSKKQTPGGDIKYKARLVAVGCNQKLGINYEESFAPVIRLETARIMLSLAAIYKMKIKQFDVKSAYLYGDLKEKVYMERPPGFARENNKVCELRKSIYGLPQSGYYWNEKLHNTLVSLGLIRIEGEPCAYISESGQHRLMIGIYVDDFLIIGSDDIIIEKTVSKVRQYFELTEIKDKNFLNIKIIENEDGIQLSQAAYIEKILKKYNLEGYNPVKTPMCPTQDLDVYEDSPKVDKTKYQELLGSLMYVAIGTRPDISYAISRLSQYNQEPRVMHLTAVKRVYRYLKGTMDYKLQYDRQESQLTMSTDASWSVTKDAKSYGAYVTKIGNNLITWKCQKQQLVALSTCEAELLAICEGVREIKWIKTILEGIGMGHLCKNPIEVNTDSKAAIEWINKDKVTNRTKHINRKYYFVKDEVKEKRVKLKHTKSEENEADLLTKGLTEEKDVKPLVYHNPDPQKRCRECYKYLSARRGRTTAANKSKSVTTFCRLCEGEPPLCLTCLKKNPQKQINIKQCGKCNVGLHVDCMEKWHK